MDIGEARDPAGLAHAQAAAPWPLPGPGARKGVQHFDAGEGNLILPELHRRGAATIARDRWERLETTIVLPYSREKVWQVLTDPSRLSQWLAVSVGSFLDTDRDMVLDFEDGEYFLVRPVQVVAPKLLRYYARWLGIGQATCVTWQLEDIGMGTHLVVVEEAQNPPWDWQTWNGGGWPGILEQLAAHIRTGLSWRWPWRRMGPYVQIELPVPVYDAWDRLFGSNCLKYWLIAMSGGIEAGTTIPIMMGDASGGIDMLVDRVVGPGQEPPSFLPRVEYRLRRPAWGREIGGRLWLEPAGWGRCLLQAFHYNWEALPGELQKSERRLLTGYWAEAARRAQQMIVYATQRAAPHNW